MELRGVGEHQPGVDPRANGESPLGGAQGSWVEAGAGPAVESRVQRPCDDPGDYGGEYDVDVRSVDLVLSAQDFLRPEIEHAVGSKGRRRPEVQVEEPDSAVDDGEPQGQQSVHRAHGQPVEGELQCLVG